MDWVTLYLGGALSSFLWVAVAILWSRKNTDYSFFITMFLISILWPIMLPVGIVVGIFTFKPVGDNNESRK